MQTNVQTDQTCWSNMIQHCWVVLDGIWSLLDCVGCWSVQTNPIPSNNVGFRYHARKYGVLLITRAKMLDDIGWKGWTKSNFIQHRPTCLNVLFKRVKYAASRYVWCSTKFDPFEQARVFVNAKYCVFYAKKLIWEAKNEMLCVPGTHKIDRTLRCK